MPPAEIERLDKWAKETGQTRTGAARKAIIERLDQEDI
jgi:predicted DNA-binding protein